VLAVTAVAFAVSLWMGGTLAQAAPPARAGEIRTPARDGEIRVAYSDLLRETEIWLTIEPRSPDGKPAPNGMILTVRRTFDGKVPLGPAALFGVRVSAGLMDAPRAELLLAGDGAEVDLAGGNPQALQKTSEGVYLAATIPAETLKRGAAASRITGNALGFSFELTAAQREALRAFVTRAMSDDPANAK
jgi:hypothetical protein